MSTVYHYLYKIVRQDGSYYIGVHTTRDLNDGYFGSGKLIKRSIAKHGKEAHSKIILEFVDTREQLLQREQEFVTTEMLADELCMNLKPGGTGGFGRTNKKQMVETIKQRYGDDFYKKIASSAVRLITDEYREQKRQIALSNNSGKSNLGKIREKITCPHCNKSGAKNVMVRFHFDKCRVRVV